MSILNFPAYRTTIMTVQAIRLRYRMKCDQVPE